MGIRERVSAAMAALRGETGLPGPRDRRAPAARKASVFSFPDWMRATAKWNWQDRYQDYVEEGYRLNSLVYAPVRYKARSIASVPLLAAQGDIYSPEAISPAHPLASLVRRPNRFQSWRGFNEQRKTYLELAGNAYVYIERARRSGEVQALYNLRPDRVRLVPDAKGIKGYYYLPPGRDAGDGFPLLPEDVSHVKYPNPLDDLEGMGYGLPPLLSVARDADTDNDVSAFIKLVFQRGAMPLGMLRFEVELTEEDADTAKRRWMDKYGGYEQWIDPLIVDKGGSYERIGMTFDELGFDVLDARNEARILSAFGVPPILLGTRYGIAHGTYSNYEEARTQFWQDVLIPELSMLEEEDQRMLQWADGTFVYYDLSVVPALQADVPALVEAAYTLFQMGVPANIALPAVGLTVDSVPGGDASYITTGVQPAGMDDADGEDSDMPSGRVVEDGVEETMPDLTAQEDEKTSSPPPLRANEFAGERGEGIKSAPGAGAAADPKEAAPGIEAPRRGRWSDEQKARQWKAMDDIALRHEDRFRAFAAAQFEADRRAVLAAISEAREKARQRKATINWQAVEPDVMDVLDQAGDRWRSAFVPLVRGVVTDVAEHWRVEAGLAFDVTRLEDQAFFTTFAADFWQHISLTSRQDILGVIQTGMREGWSIPQMQQGLDAVFQQWIGGNGDPDLQRFASGRVHAWRTELIARTESTRATSAAAVQTYKAAGVRQKEWIATSDERTRPSHMAANGQVRDIDDYFEVGGYRMAQPGDSSQGAPVSEVGNCRCSALPVLPEAEDVPAVSAPAVQVETQPAEETQPQGPAYTISDSLELPRSGKVRELSNSSLEALDRLLGVDQQLPELPVRAMRQRFVGGEYVRSRTGKSVQIRVNPTEAHPRTSLLHEIGHFIHHRLMSQAPDTGDPLALSAMPADMLQWWDVAKKSAGVRQLTNALNNGGLMIDASGAPALVSRRWLEYAASPHEVWARSFAQYVATRGDDAGLQAELSEMQAESGPGEWSTSDFEPIADAMDTLFRGRGWLRK